ncbi:hypothetical protein [Pseudomonas fontis]|uniref:Uncharacterized protein n=1 Tax=Pseudomonas fontis TaxID=2942633 RepID=A0ABT5NQX7_9PSED|nr:hypothetical protein [Pseudomonas fontis]MDD0972647.1 hypothetical protein [Pseudomonas fontis]MDD0990549.1 hypothetical protein [Pseudomonas fontis]
MSETSMHEIWQLTGRLSDYQNANLFAPVSAASLFDDASSSVGSRVELLCYDSSTLVAKCRAADIQVTLHGQWK